MRYVPARLPPESCLITSGSSQSSDSAAARLVAGREEAGRASRRMGWRWCWRWARTRPVERPRVRGAAVRRRAVRQRVAVAILLFWKECCINKFIILEKRRSRQVGQIVEINNLASHNGL